MPEAKNNRRVRFTRSALREAFIDLLIEKPILSITVKDICARADINRSTFYLLCLPGDKPFLTKDFSKQIGSSRLSFATAEDLQALLGFLRTTPQENDYSVIGAFTPQAAVGHCVYCNHCQPCPAGIDIGLVNKYYDLSQAGIAWRTITTVS